MNGYEVSWYDGFNALEAGLWWLVAIALPLAVARGTPRQQLSVWLASGSFLVFGVTDLLELRRDGVLPVWLWGLKIACGFTILMARFTWVGWERFNPRCRELAFAGGCLLAVLSILAVQHYLGLTPG